MLRVGAQEPVLKRVGLVRDFTVLGLTRESRRAVRLENPSPVVEFVVERSKAGE